MQGETFLSVCSWAFFKLNLAARVQLFVVPHHSLDTADSTAQLGPRYTPSSGREGYWSTRDVLPHTATQWVVIDALCAAECVRAFTVQSVSKGKMEQNKTSSNAAYYVNASCFLFLHKLFDFLNTDGTLL